ncbi:hypothetical protein, no similarity [Geotrichum candidum]|uniref:Uncharacterized protein n=1 Tax=Geotrichum candidum TaxID=1173061 RepID=A0A0J9XH83_GEOCN|nr:hypothetical protein, no similarity [Geotrichum candidum]
MKFLKAILKHLQTSKATGTCNSNNNSSNNACCYNSPQKLFLVHLPNEILSIVILELLNEWCLMKSVHNRYIRGLLDILPISPEISTKRMIPLSKVNKLFYCLVWTVTLKHSYWNQNPYKQHGSVWGMYFLKMEPFVFTKKTVQSRGIEPVNMFYIKGPIHQHHLDYVHKLCLEYMPFLVSSIGTGINRTFKVPKLKYLTTMSLSTHFLINSALKYKIFEEKLTDHWMRSHEMFGDINIKLPPFVEAMMKTQTTDKTAINEKIIAYYEVLICQAITKMISSLDHPVECTIRHVRSASRELEIVLWCFERENITCHIRTLMVSFDSDTVISNHYIKLLAALDLEHICLVCDKHEALTKKIFSLLIENKTSLRTAYYKTDYVVDLSFPDHLQFLDTQSHIFLSELNAPFSQRFDMLIELVLEFQVQIHQNFIEKSILHFPALQTLTVSGEIRYQH